jgi:RimJ/RimL family protein N-acetyltransferase
MNTTMQDAGTIELIDGTMVSFRPILPADAPALQRFHARLSKQSIYLRFFSYQPTLSDTQARYFTELDGDQRFALVALDPLEPGEIAGVVRYERDPASDRAEYAAVVADRWQGKGLGLGLTRQLIASARRRGIQAFYALVLFENTRMLNLFRDLNLPERVVWEHDLERVEILLDPPRGAELPVVTSPSDTPLGRLSWNGEVSGN